MKEIEVGSVVQANEKAKEWCGCLLIVNKVKKWGIMGGTMIPYKGMAYIRLPLNAVEYIGTAVLVPDN